MVGNITKLHADDKKENIFCVILTNVGTFYAGHWSVTPFWKKVYKKVYYAHYSMQAIGYLHQILSFVYLIMLYTLIFPTDAILLLSVWGVFSGISAQVVCTLWGARALPWSLHHWLVSPILPMLSEKSIIVILCCSCSQNKTNNYQTFMIVIFENQQ